MTDYAAIVEKQNKRYLSGRTKSCAYRIEQLKKLKRSIRFYRDDIFRALKEDLNKCQMEAYLTEISFVENEIDYTIRHLAGWMRTKVVPTGLTQFPGVSKIYHDPYGVVLIISPWNYPFQLTMMPLIGAIAGGNCAVVKPSDYAPATSHVIQKIVANIFDPSYVVVVEGDLHVNTALLNLKFDYIFFTGIVKVGKIVMEKASHHLTPVTLELGGKSPCIVDETADIKVAARRIVWGKSINAGQTCVAPDYVYVHKSVKQSLINAMVAELRAAYGENGLQSTILPKIINDGHFDRLLGYMDGANVVFGGKSDRESRRIEVSVLDLDGEDHPVMGEEIFGPLLPVIGYTSLDDLIAAMQKKSKPLALYLFTKSRKNRDLVLGQLQFGGGCVNETVLHITSNSMPFGGVGDSGMGGYHGRASFDSFTREKGVLIKPNAVDFAFRYPRTWPAIEAKWAALQQLLRPVSPPGRRETS